MADIEQSSEQAIREKALARALATLGKHFTVAIIIVPDNSGDGQGDYLRACYSGHKELCEAMLIVAQNDSVVVQPGEDRKYDDGYGGDDE